MRLLLVEDNERLAQHVCAALQAGGFVVDAVGSAADADAAVRGTPYDSILLDLGLPDEDGVRWLERQRRRDPSTPILVLTARDSTESLVEALNKGADDYLRKPFENAELIARIRALLRRPGSTLGHVLAEGNVSLDTGARELTVAGTAVEVGRRELDCLELLLRRTGRVVPKPSIESAIYGGGEEIASNAIEVLVHRLRRRIQDAGGDVVIHTVRGVGYMLTSGPRP